MILIANNKIIPLSIQYKYPKNHSEDTSVTIPIKLIILMQIMQIIIIIKMQIIIIMQIIMIMESKINKIHSLTFNKQINN